MKISVSFTPVSGLADVILCREDRANLFPSDKPSRKPFKPDDSYSGRCAEITELLRRASARGCRELAVEILPAEALPDRLRDKPVPAVIRGRIEPFPGRVLHERLLKAYLSPEDIMRERKRRGAPVRCCVMSVQRFLELAADNSFGARLITEDSRFDLPRSQFSYILFGAARLAREEAEPAGTDEAPSADANPAG